MIVKQKENLSRDQDSFQAFSMHRFISNHKKRLTITTWMQTPRVGPSFHPLVPPWTPNQTLTSLRQSFYELLDSPQKCLLFDCETKGELNKRSRFIYSILLCSTLLALEEGYYHAPEYHPAKKDT